ncbi:hypothetical protein MKW92_019954 [Papaver armeniacum]|nr:hypothetical protein MKW92_019954 [Papaver armeniacum]
MAPLRDLMSIMTEFPSTLLFVYLTAIELLVLFLCIMRGEGAERHCAINETHYEREEMFLMLMKAIEERAEEIVTNNRKVFYLEVVSLSDYDEVFFEVSIS